MSKSYINGRNEFAHIGLLKDLDTLIHGRVRWSPVDVPKFSTLLYEIYTQGLYDEMRLKKIIPWTFFQIFSLRSWETNNVDGHDGQTT